MAVKKAVKKTLVYITIGSLALNCSGCQVGMGVEYALSGSFDSVKESFYPKKEKGYNNYKTNKKYKEESNK